MSTYDKKPEGLTETQWTLAKKRKAEFDASGAVDAMRENASQETRKLGDVEEREDGEICIVIVDSANDTKAYHTEKECADDLNALLDLIDGTEQIEARRFKVAANTVGYSLARIQAEKMRRGIILDAPLCLHKDVKVPNPDMEPN